MTSAHIRKRQKELEQWASEASLFIAIVGCLAITVAWTIFLVGVLT